MSVSSPPIDQVLAAVLDELDGYLPAANPGVPAPSLSVASLKERPIGLCNRRGVEARGPFALMELKGVRLEGVVRFELWAANPAATETAANDLSAVLLANRDPLWNEGFLRLGLESASPPEFVTAFPAWRKQANYGFLFEYRYLDTDGAHSLIAQIPVHSDPEDRASLQRETTVVRDEMTHWDDDEAPALVVAGCRSVSRVHGLAFFPGAVPTDTVTLRRTFDGTVGSPTACATLADFLAAVRFQLEDVVELLFPLVSRHDSQPASGGVLGTSFAPSSGKAAGALWMKGAKRAAPSANSIKTTLKLAVPLDSFLSITFVRKRASTIYCGR